MARNKIDREKLHVALRGLGKEPASSLLEAAIDLVPSAKLVALVGRYVDVAKLGPDSKRTGTLLRDVKTFEKASLAGRYYESFDVNSKNFMEESKGTRVWIAECERMFDRCVAHSTRAEAAGAREAFEILFGLLRRVDEGHDDVIFFADEGGSWQVGVDWRKVLPAWFTCLAVTADAEEYARMVVKVVDEFNEHNRDQHLAAARKVASAAQKRAMAALPQPARTSRRRPRA